MASRKTNPTAVLLCTGLALDAMGWAVAEAPAPISHGAGSVLTAGLTLTASGLAMAWGRRGSSAAMMSKLDKQSKRGTASRLDLAKSRHRIKQKAAVLRPGVYASRRRGSRVNIDDLAFRIARVGRSWVYSSCEDGTIRFAGPRMGKTSELACQVVDAPGAVVVTSTSKDIVVLTAGSRAAGGRALHVFNPEGIAGWGSTLKWSPLIGCRNAAIAQDRAADMIPQSGDDRGERWDAQARDALAILMHAAALAGRDMQAVLSWVADPMPDTSGREVEAALRKSSEWQAMTRSARQFFTLAAGPKTSVTMTMRPALEWLRDPKCARIGDAAEGELFDVAGFIERGETVYLLGQDTGRVAPLIAALTAEIVRQARAIATRKPGGRLDPCLTIALDEAYRICRVPLHKWTSDMGKLNIALHISLQSPAQLIDGWGETAASVILDNCATVIVYGGLKSPASLETLSALMGSQEIVVETRDKDGKVTSTTTRREPVFSPDRLSELREGWAAVRIKGCPAVLGRAQSAYKRRDIRRAMSFTPVEETDFEASFEEADA